MTAYVCATKDGRLVRFREELFGTNKEKAVNRLMDELAAEGYENIEIEVLEA